MERHDIGFREKRFFVCRRPMPIRYRPRPRVRARPYQHLHAEGAGVIRHDLGDASVAIKS